MALYQAEGGVLLSPEQLNIRSLQRRSFVTRAEHPCYFSDNHDSNKSRGLFRELFDDLAGARRLDRIVLDQIADQDAGIETFHRSNPSMPPAR